MAVTKQRTKKIGHELKGTESDIRNNIIFYKISTGKDFKTQFGIIIINAAAFNHIFRFLYWITRLIVKLSRKLKSCYAVNIPCHIIYHHKNIILENQT